MAAEESIPEEANETEEQEEQEEGKEELGAHPDISHWPIGCAIVNLNNQDNLAFEAYRGKRPYVWTPQSEGHGGDKFLVTLTLEGEPVLPGDLPLNIELRYHARQRDGEKTHGNFLFQANELVTFRALAPNSGDHSVSFELQSIRFDLELASHGDAEIIIKAYHKGQYVSNPNKEGNMTLHPPL